MELKESEEGKRVEKGREESKREDRGRGKREEKGRKRGIERKGELFYLFSSLRKTMALYISNDFHITNI